MKGFSRPLLLLCALCIKHATAQQILISQNFEDKQIGPAWQIISGNWHVGDVQEMRIAPAENGFQYVLCSGGPGFVGSNLIRLHVDLPDSSKATKIKLSFSYYVLANEPPGTTVEAEFYKKEQKDGLKGKVWHADLRIIKRWKEFQKVLEIPVGADTFRVVFYGPESSGKTSRIVCYDNIVITMLIGEPISSTPKH